MVRQRQRSSLFFRQSDVTLFHKDTIFDESEDNLDTTVVDLSTLSDRMRKLLESYDTNGDGTLSLRQLAMGAQKHGRTEQQNQHLFSKINLLMLLLIISMIFNVGLSVGFGFFISNKIETSKETYVNPSTGIMTVKKPPPGSSLSLARRLSSTIINYREVPSSDTDPAIETIAVVVNSQGNTHASSGYTVTDPGTGDVVNCYSEEEIIAMFLSISSGAATMLAEKNPTNGDFCVHQLGGSTEPIAWTDDAVQLGGGVVAVPNSICTNDARRGRHLSEVTEGTMKEHHRSLKDHVFDAASSSSGRGGGTPDGRSNRNLNRAKIYYSTVD